MESELDRFEAIVRRALYFTEASAIGDAAAHPFDQRNVHPDLPADVRALFDNGHYSQASFEALKFLDEEIQRISGDPDFGRSLMMRMFGGTPPPLRLNPGMTV